MKTTSYIIAELQDFLPVTLADDFYDALQESDDFSFPSNEDEKSLLSLKVFKQTADQIIYDMELGPEYEADVEEFCENIKVLEKMAKKTEVWVSI